MLEFGITATVRCVCGVQLPHQSWAIIHLRHLQWVRRKSETKLDSEDGDPTRCVSADGLRAFCAPLVSTQFAQKPHWSFHYLCSLGFSLVNLAILQLVFKGRKHNGDPISVVFQTDRNRLTIIRATYINRPDTSGSRRESTSRVQAYMESQNCSPVGCIFFDLCW